MSDLYASTIIYYRNFGAYPITDVNGTWYDKLVAQNYIGGTRNTLATAAGTLPADLYGFPIVYAPPANPEGGFPLIRCVGENGVDDGGLLDDWDWGKEPNLGYWYKWNWPALYRRAWICGIGAAFVAGSILLLVRSRMIAIGSVALAIGSIGAFGLPYGFSGAGLGRHTASHIPHWVDGVALLGLLLVLVGLLLLGFAGTRVMHRRGLEAVGKCPMCKYDLRGELAAGCPECGWGRDDVSER